MPELIAPDLYPELFGLDVQEFYTFREMYVMPAIVNRRSYVLTPDSITALFLLKYHKGWSDRDLGIMFGISRTQANKFWHLITDSVFQTSQFLLRGRSLSQENNLQELFEELHAAAVNNSRCYAIFQPQILQYEANNPNEGPMKFVEVAWDSRHIPVEKISNHDLQRRAYSSKIGRNALVKLVGAGMDSIVRIVYMLAASVSPSHTDEQVARFIIDMEANLGLTGGLRHIFMGLRGYYVVHLFDKGEFL